MRLRWTEPAAQDLYIITEYIRRDNPSAAHQVAKTFTILAKVSLTPLIVAEKENSPELVSWFFHPYLMLPYIAS